MRQKERKEARKPARSSHVRSERRPSKKLYAPVNGRIVPLSDIKDPILAQKLLGEGVAFVFTEDLIYSPCYGTLVMISNDRHAMGIESENGDQVLVNLGLEEQNQRGRGYHVLVSQGQRVKTGQPIMRLDRAWLDAQDFDLTLAMIVTNRDPSQFQVFQSERAVVGRVVVMEKI